MGSPLARPLPVAATTTRRATAAVIAVGAAALTAATVLATQDPAGGRLPRCPFHSVTGLWCPGCGAQRGLHALAHGDVIGALGFNALMILALPLLVYAYVAWAARVAGVRDLSPLRLPTAVVRLLPALVVAFGVVRNLPVGSVVAP